MISRVKNCTEPRAFEVVADNVIAKTYPTPIFQLNVEKCTWMEHYWNYTLRYKVKLEAILFFLDAPRDI